MLFLLKLSFTECFIPLSSCGWLKTPLVDVFKDALKNIVMLTVMMAIILVLNGLKFMFSLQLPALGLQRRNSFFSLSLSACSPGCLGYISCSIFFIIIFFPTLSIFLHSQFHPHYSYPIFFLPAFFEPISLISVLLKLVIILAFSLSDHH